MRNILIILCAFSISVAVAQPSFAQGPVINTGPTGSSSYKTPDYSPIQRGYEKLGEGIARGIRERRQREARERAMQQRAQERAQALARQDGANRALAAVLAALSSGGPAAAMQAIQENPMALSHPQFPVVMQMMQQHGR